MHFIDYFLRTFIQKDFILKFYYKKFIINNLPCFKQIILTFNFNTIDLKFFLSTLLLLETISFKKVDVLKAKKLNITVKIKKGQPIGCKVCLKKKYLYLFFENFLTSNFLKSSKLLNLNYISFSISDFSKFKIKFLDDSYYFLNKIPRLNVIIIFNKKKKKEFLFLLNSLKL